MHLVNWKNVTKSKDKGGLGIRNLELLNRGVLGKWAWRFAMEEDSAWRKLISIKYGTNEGGCGSPACLEAVLE